MVSIPLCRLTRASASTSSRFSALLFAIVLNPPFDRFVPSTTGSSKTPFSDTPLCRDGEEKKCTGASVPLLPLRGPLLTRAATGPLRQACACVGECSPYSLRH